MKNASALYDAVLSYVGQCPWQDQRHLYVLVWMVMGLIFEGSVNLTRWIAHVDTSAQQAQSSQRRFSRWLHNPRIHPGSLYRPLIQAALAKWQDPILYVSLDTTMLWDQFCVIRLSVVYRGRAIPLIWRVIEHGSSSVHFIVYQDLLDKARLLLPEGIKIVLLADRGFVDFKLVNHIRQVLGWHYRIRIKSSSCVYRPGKGWQTLSSFHFAPGEAVMLQGVTLHKTHSLKGVNLALARENQTGQLWFIVSSEKTTLNTFWEYSLRFDIEENFLDDKSNGFEWENSRLRCPVALSRLCLVMAVATLFLTQQGTAVMEAEQRKRVDPHWFRGMSYLKIGWTWVKTALTRGWALFPPIALLSKRDPQTAMASKSQFERRLYSREFKVRSFDYAA
jgi:hypothetical protein